MNYYIINLDLLERFMHHTTDKDKFFMLYDILMERKGYWFA